MFPNKHIIEMPSWHGEYKVRGIESHLLSPCHASDVWHKFAERHQREPNSYWIGVGDLIDPTRPSTRKRKTHALADRKEALVEDDRANEAWLRQDILPKIEKVKDRCLGLLDGDHYIEFANGDTSTKFICDALKIPYLGSRMAYVGLFFRRGFQTVLYKILARHGKGACGTVGADLNRLIAQNIRWNADCYMGGHTHQENAAPVPRGDINDEFTDYKFRTQWFIRCGAMLRGFVMGQEHYPEKKEYGPLVCGWGEIDIAIGKKHSNNNNLAIQESSGRTLAF